MKKISMALILVCFAVVAFVPRTAMPEVLYWSLFPVMCFLLFIYWRASYWVKTEDVMKLCGDSLVFDAFCGKIPHRTEDDLTRGRFVIHSGKAELYQRTGGKERSTCPCRKVWELDCSEIKSLRFGKVLPMRKGFVICTSDSEISFVCSKVVKKKQHLVDALGWNRK